MRHDGIGAICAGRRPVWLVVVLCVLGVARSVFGQDAGEVKLEVERFGVANVSRPGDWIGVRVVVTDSAPKQREVVVRVSTVDPDGDRPTAQRAITTNPGVRQGVWLYFRLPAWFGTGDNVEVAAFEAVEEAKGEPTITRTGDGYAAGRLLGRGRFGAKKLAIPGTALNAVLGPKSFGLTRYDLGASGLGSDSYAAFGHERIGVESGLTTDDLPDKWMGLAEFDVIVWGAGEPGGVVGDRAEALKQWVKRGGHLVVVLPTVGEKWTSAGATELSELLPKVAIRRREGVDLEAYRRLITFKRKEERVLPAAAVVYDLSPAADSTPAEASRVLDGPDGNCVVARRRVGAGNVTLVGLDLNDRVLADQEALEPSVFWNRVLGRRGLVESSARLSPGQPSPPARLASSTVDEDIAGMIAKSRSAAAGVLLGVGVFVVYWALAGPVGYAVLKRRGMVRHSWVGYVAAAGAFTAIAWGGAAVIRPNRIEAFHLTLLDHVYGQPMERARSWMTVLLPWYGEATISVGDPATADGDIVAIAPYDVPNSSTTGFPDARPYVFEARKPRLLVTPARATAKQVQVEWAGGPPWKMLTPVNDDGSIGKLTLRSSRGPREGWIGGRVMHNLPGPLSDVRLIVVKPQKLLDTSNGNLATQLITDAQAYYLGDWAPGAAGTKDLNEATQVAPGVNAAADGLLRDLVQKNASSALGGGSSASTSDRMLAIALFSQLEPPPATTLSTDSAFPVVKRRQTQGWDLGVYFTQPCVIIVGILGSGDSGVESPVPLYVDGTRAPTSGVTVVRWVYPLGDAPPVFAKPGETEGGEAERP